jgi:hypothetical protein
MPRGNGADGWPFEKTFNNISAVRGDMTYGHPIRYSYIDIAVVAHIRNFAKRDSMQVRGVMLRENDIQKP